MSSQHPASFIHAQRGLSLIFALLALMALSLGAVALVRSIDTGTVVLGNLGFKQAATASTDTGVKDALTALQSLSDKTANASSSAYYATAYDNLDVTGQRQNSGRVLVDWDGDSCAYAAGTVTSVCTLQPATSTTDSNVKYAIFRLCKTTGDINLGTNNCAQPGSGSGGEAAARNSIDASAAQRFRGKPGAFYRIVVRAKGARNTTSFTETIVQY